MVKTVHRSTNHQGILIAVDWKHKEGKRMTVKQIDPKKLQDGKKMVGMCIHHVGGSTNATITAKRRAKVRRDHEESIRKHCGGVPGRCKEHQVDWKRRAACGAA